MALKAVVAGSAYMDIHFSADLDKQLHIAFGGSGHNLAVNLAALSVNTEFVGVETANPIMQLLFSQMRQMNIRTHLKKDSSSKTLGQISVYKNKELKLRDRATILESIKFGHNFLEPISDTADVLLIDLNFNIKDIESFIKLSHHKKLPLVITGTSAKQVTKLLKTHKLSAKDILVLRRSEFKSLQEFTGLMTLDDLQKKIGCNIILTASDKGVIWQTQKESGQQPPPEVLEKDDFQQGSGARELLTAGFVREFFERKLGWEESLKRAQQSTLEIMNSERTNLEPTDAFLSAIQLSFSKAEIDQLTNISNRNGLISFMDKDQGLFDNRYILLVDIDHFKHVNDTHGHDAGDIVLKSLAEILMNCMRDGDIAARWGGEEFICLVNARNADEATAAAERIRLEVERRYFSEINDNITISLGVSKIMETFDASFKQADLALYEAKKTGRNKVVYSTDL